MRLLILPNDIDLSKVDVDVEIIIGTAVYQITKASGVAYVLDHAGFTVESNR